MKMNNCPKCKYGTMIQFIDRYATDHEIESGRGLTICHYECNRCNHRYDPGSAKTIERFALSLSKEPSFVLMQHIYQDIALYADKYPGDDEMLAAITLELAELTLAICNKTNRGHERERAMCLAELLRMYYAPRCCRCGEPIYNEVQIECSCKSQIACHKCSCQCWDCKTKICTKCWTACRICGELICSACIAYHIDKTAPMCKFCLEEIQADEKKE